MSYALRIRHSLLVTPVVRIRHSLLVAPVAHAMSYALHMQVLVVVGSMALGVEVVLGMRFKRSHHHPPPQLCLQCLMHCKHCVCNVLCIAMYCNVLCIAIHCNVLGIANTSPHPKAWHIKSITTARVCTCASAMSYALRMLLNRA